MKMNLKGRGSNRLRSISTYRAGIRQEGLRKTIKISSQVERSLGRDSN
jgi:hypothetical protein